MLAVVKEKRGRGWKLKDVPKPTPDRHEVLIRVKRIGICGSDMAIFDGREEDINLPIIPGHEFAGEIVRCGEGSGLPIGSRVAVNLVNNCGHCFYCKAGYPNRCEHTNLIGFHTNGGFAEFVSVPSRNCHLLPEGMDWEDAASAEPVTSALAAMKKARIRSSDSVAIIGPGPIGLYACQIAALEGAHSIYVVGTRENRLEIASALGAGKTYLVNRDGPNEDVRDRIIHDAGGLGADVVLEASGNSSALDFAIGIAAKGARIVLVSIFHEHTNITPMDIVFKEAHILGSFDYGWKDFEDGLKLIQHKRVETRSLVSHSFPLSQIDRGISLMEERQALKVMIEP
jgi:2-desacetyl-2-hydroxyethyl bacteriochlorophyllide A dehydrogenase